MVRAARTEVLHTDQPKRNQNTIELGQHEYTSFHDWFLNDPVFRDSQLETFWTEESWSKMADLAQQGHQYVATLEERLRYKNVWPYFQRYSGKDTTITRHRDDYKKALVKFCEALKTAGAKGEMLSRALLGKIVLANEVLTRSSNTCSNVNKQH